MIFCVQVFNIVDTSVTICTNHYTLQFNLYCVMYCKYCLLNGPIILSFCDVLRDFVTSINRVLVRCVEGYCSINLIIKKSFIKSVLMCVIVEVLASIYLPNLELLSTTNGNNYSHIILTITLVGKLLK